jgi:hypothetical protein
MSNRFKKIEDSLRYARTNNIDPCDLTTWDDNYLNRQKELMRILPSIEEDFQKLKEGIEKARKSGKL